MTIAPIFKKAYWSLAAAGGLYFLFISLLLNGRIQRHALYAYKLHTAWWQDLNKPEQFGFLKGQIQPFNIHTPDGEVLYAWHILPLALYARNEAVLLSEPWGIPKDVTQTMAFQLLSLDPESRLVVNFHGNAGTVGQGWRTDTYRALASGAADKIHVLTVDYRGFGYSTGSPTEQGLITDGIALVRWAVEVAKIPPERIVILGQSLGTAVATAAAEYHVVEQHVDFAGLVLVAAFSDIPKLMLTYAIGGVFPVLSMLRPYPKLQAFFANHVLDTWRTSSRLANLVRYSRTLNLHLIHARNDFDIPWTHSDALFYVAANATSEAGMTLKQIDGVKHHQDQGEGGYTNTWTASGRSSTGRRRITQRIVRYGGKYTSLKKKATFADLDTGHNRIVTYPVVAKTVLQIFDL